MRPSKYFIEYSRKFAYNFWFGLGCLLVTSSLDVIPPLVLMRGIDQIADKADLSKLLETTIIYFVLAATLALLRYYWRYIFGGFHHGVATDLRRRVFEKLTNVGPSFYNKNPTGELMSLVTNDIEAVRMGIGPGVLVVVDAGIYLILVPIIMFSLSVTLTLQTLILMPLLPFIIRKLSDLIHRRFIEVQEKFSYLSGVCQENIAGMRIIKSFAQEDNHIKIFESASTDWKNANLKVAWADSFFHPIMDFCVAAGVVVLLYLGTKQIATGALTVGTFVAFSQYIMKMTWPMTAIGWGVSLISQGQASLSRIDEFLSIEPDVKPPLVNTLVNLNGPIVIKDLEFAYPDTSKFVLKNISMTIEPGAVLGIIGSVGSGKTTLAQLICHLYAIPRGKIEINGFDINDIPLQTLRRHISLVPQDTFLFSTTIMENMSFGSKKDITFEAVQRMADVAKIRDEIDNLPNSFNTHLGERGVNLSGGQKQRLAISRALLRESPVVIFDDTLSAVDSETESVILKRIAETNSKRTTIIISHRLSSLVHCQKILVLRGGEIEAIGSPKELIGSNATYRELLKLQGLT